MTLENDKDEIELAVPKFVSDSALFKEKYFTFVKCVDNGGVIAMCNTCKEVRKASNKSNSNFYSHMKRCHRPLLRNAPGYRSVAHENLIKKGASVSGKALENAIIRFIVQDMQPLMRTETDGFLNLIAVCLGYSSKSEIPIKIISARTVGRRISEMYTQHVENVKNILSKQQWFCLTMDIWSCKTRSFLGVSIHYIDDESFERKSLVLCCEDFPRPHTHQHIAERVQMLYEKFSLMPSSIVASVTDNGSNFVCAFKNFGRTSNFYQHLRQVCNEDDEENVTRDTDILKITDSLIKLSDEYGECFFEEDANILYDIINSSDDELDSSASNQNGFSYGHDWEFIYNNISNEKLIENEIIILPNRIPCNTHTLNLIGSVDSLAAHKNRTYSKLYETIFEKLNLLWNACGKQQSSQIIKEILGRNLHRPNQTRWNWQYDEISKITNLDKIKLRVTMMTLNITPFTDTQITFLLEYQCVLKPIAVAIDNLQQNKAPYGIVLPTLYVVNKQLQKMKNENSLKSCKPLMNSVLNGFNKRLGHMLDINDEKSHPALIATVAHPFFKLRWIVPEERQQENVNKIIKILVNAAHDIFIEKACQLNEIYEKTTSNQGTTGGMGSEGTSKQLHII